VWHSGECGPPTPVPTGGRREGEEVGRGEPGPGVVPGVGEVPTLFILYICSQGSRLPGGAVSLHSLDRLNTSNDLPKKNIAFWSRLYAYNGSFFFFGKSLLLFSLSTYVDYDERPPHRLVGYPTSGLVPAPI